MTASASAYASAVLADAPLAYYRLNDSGTVAADSGPNRLDATIGSAITTGNASVIQDASSASMGFPATSVSAASQVRASETPQLEPTNALTEEFWVMPRAIGGDVVEYGNDVLYEPYATFFGGDGEICAWINTTTKYYGPCSGATLRVGLAYHVAVTYDGTSIRIYINGALESTSPASGNLAGYDGTNGLALGGGYALADGSMNGIVQDVAIYGTALSPDRIVAHYQARAPGSMYSNSVLGDGPFAFYRLNEAGTTAFDSGPNGIDAGVGSSVVTGDASLDNDGPAMRFPGGTESPTIQARVPGTRAFEPTLALSIEFWTKPSPPYGGDILSYGNDNGSEPYSINMDSSGHVGIWTHTINDGGSTMSSNASLNANQTYHVVATYDGTARCIYINGNVDACSPETGAITGYNWSSGLAIGGGYEFSDGAYPGIVAGVALYSKVLSPNQIVAHYHAGLVPTGITPVPTGPTPTPTNTPVTNPTTTPGTTPRVSPGNSFTGINPWWTFEEGAIPGVGKYLANVGTGLNLLVQADDMAIPNRGIELAFRRTYNSESGHDLNGDDGGPAGNYGAGWTNTFDAGIAYNSGNANGIGLSIFDIDGARYDYLPDGAGNWIPPAGQHAKLRWDGANGYLWTKKSGTTYYFFSPALASDPRYAGVAGRVDIIWGRNQNNRLDFYYSFSDPSATSAATLTTLDIVTDSTGSTARHAVVTFADFNGKRLARSLQWPNGQLVTYSYDTAEHLIEVDEPPNSTSTTSCQGVPSCLPQAYQYYAGTNLMQWAAGPRWMISGATDGGYEAFRYYNAGGIAEVDDVGNVNPSISDGYSTGSIQTNGPNTSSYYIYRQVLFDVSGSTTLWHDTDGHETDYTYDGSGRSSFQFAGKFSDSHSGK